MQNLYSYVTSYKRGMRCGCLFVIMAITQMLWTNFLNGINKEKNIELFTYLEERELLTEVNGKFT